MPSAAPTVVRQERTATPSRWMVQAPQTPAPQPNFVPVSPTSSRRYQSSGMFGSPLKVRFSPFTVMVGMS